MEAGSRVHTAWHRKAGQPIHQDTSGGRSLLRGRRETAGLPRLSRTPRWSGAGLTEHCPRRKLALEIQACRHHTSGPPPCHSMIGESATSISSLPAQPTRRMISAQPLRLQAAPSGCPSTRTWRPSPLVGGQTITERSAIRQASPAVTPRASGRSPRCLTGRCAVPGGVLVRLNARTKVALDTFTQAAEGRRDLINAARARGTSGKAGRAPPHRPPGERQRPAVRSPRRRSLTARQTGSRAGHRATVGRAPPTRDIPPRCATESRSEHGAAPEAQGGPTTP
jgi:hypothetical protein